MELGATVCSFKAPRCLLCPVQQKCVAFLKGMQESLPSVKKRQETVRVLLFAVVQRNRNGKVLLRQEKGLWEFPMYDELPRGSFTTAEPAGIPSRITGWR
jgi:A/G-specific adenine glycosylase